MQLLAVELLICTGMHMLVAVLSSSDQHKTSPHHISALQHIRVTGIKDVIAEDEFLDFQTRFPE